jgi:RNA polymerase sigma factor for flagellar operon FliA
MYTATDKRTADPNALLTQYMPMVKRLAHHMMGRLPPSVEEDDIVQAGMMGLLDAIGRYDDAQSAQFEAYAIQRIRGSMIDELRAADWMPRAARQTMRKIESSISRLQNTLGRQPSETEIAAAMDMPLAEYQSTLGDARGHQLLYFEDFGESSEDDSFLDKQAAGEGAMPLPQLMDARLRECIVAGINALPEREQQLMSMYYEQDMTLKEIAAVFGVTESRICQLHGQAISRIRARLKDGQWIGQA